MNGTVKVEFDQLVHDDGGNFDTTLDRFVAPDTGVYHFDAGVEFGNLADSSIVNVTIYLNGAMYTRIAAGDAYTSNGLHSQIWSGPTLMKLNAGDYVEVHAFTDDPASTHMGNPGGFITYFSGHRLY